MMTAPCVLESGFLAKAPVAYIVFNRPRHTRVTFDAIRSYRPAQLFVIADGPRDDHPNDKARCQEVRRIVSEIDWPCEVHRDFSDINLGSGRRVSSGLDWVFSLVDRAIVLEDDCLASPEFFTYCEVLLERYRECTQVWVIGGNSYQPEFQRGQASYYFSRYPDTWGWATWRRAWRHYQHDLPFLEEWQRSQRWRECFPTKSEQRHFRHIFHEALTGAVDSWDYQWVGCVLFHGGLAATPNANLVQNIGFGPEATHTVHPEGLQYRFTPGSFARPPGDLVHPSEISVNEEADEYTRLALGFGSHTRLLGRWRFRATRIVRWIKRRLLFFVK